MKKALSFLIFLLTTTLVKAQDSAEVKFPTVYFKEKSFTLTTLAKKQLDSVIAIAQQYPSKSVVMVTAFGWENTKLNQLIWNRSIKISDYLSKKKLKNELLFSTRENGMNVHCMAFQLTGGLNHPILIL